MIVFLDTEFTDLAVHSRLLSVALVADTASQPDFYAEVTDADRLQGASRFAVNTVLPQFGRVADAPGSYADAGARLGAYFASLVAEQDDGDIIVIAYSYQLDWVLVERAITDAGAADWDRTRRHIHPVNVYGTTGSAVGVLASEAYFETQEHALYARHHALCDARALRCAFEAMCACSSTCQATAPNSLPAPEVTAIATAPQKATRQVPLQTGAPPARAAKAPRPARKISAEVDTHQSN